MLPIRVTKLSKKFGATIAVDAVDLEIQPGELFTLLGPSGCGKTTLMRLLVGLDTPDAGHIYLGDVCIDAKPPHQRQMAMIFQNYAIFPHMTVAENVAYGLKAQRVAKSDVARRVAGALEWVQMSGYGPRRPDQLSGGQQQRVSLARALALQPSVVLMDEPLSNLDPPLRKAMRAEIRRLQKTFGLTTLYVTHDLEEALAISDRIAVMDQGRLLQVGPPTSLYRKPASCTVASFVGHCSFLSAELRDDYLHVGGNRFRWKIWPIDARHVIIGLRPEALHFKAVDQPDNEDEPVLIGTVEEAIFQGSYTTVQVRLSTEELVTALATNSSVTYRLGTTVALSFQTSEAILFDPETGKSLS